MSCPNYDPNFNKILNVFSLDSPNSRKNLFYNVCIFVRFIIILVVLLNYKKWWLPYIILIISLFTIYNLYSNLNGNQWWSKKFQLVISILLLIISIIAIFNTNISILIPILLLISLFGGVYQSLFIDFC